MLASKALMLATLGECAMSWSLHIPRSENPTSLAHMVSRCLIIMGSPELYYLREDSIGPDPISSTAQEIVTKVEKITTISITTTPTVTNNLPNHFIPSPTKDALAEDWSQGTFPEVDFSDHVATLVEHLLMSLVLLLLLVLYWTCIKPVHFFLSCFMDVNPVGEFLDLIDLIAEYEYATYFWLALILYRPVKSLMKSLITSVLTQVHRNFNAGEEINNRLRTTEDKVQDNTALLEALDNASYHHDATLASLGERMTIFEESFNHLSDFVQQLAMPMVTEFVKLEIDKLTDKFNHEVKGFIYRIQSLESEVKALISEIEVLRTVVSDMQMEKTILEHFYRKQIFNNQNVNEYYQRALASTRPGQVAYMMIAYQTALHMQASSSTETMRYGKDPVTPPPMSRSQNMFNGTPSHFPSSAPSVSLGSFTFGNSLGNFNFGPPSGFTAGGPPGGFTAGGSSTAGASPGDSAPGSLVPYQRR